MINTIRPRASLASPRKSLLGALAGCYRARSSPTHEHAVTRNLPDIRAFLLVSLMAATVFVTLPACTPTVKFATDKPIEVNLNVNIKHEIRVKVDKDLESVLSKDSGLF